jgi:hypothetical protein
MAVLVTVLASSQMAVLVTELVKSWLHHKWQPWLLRWLMCVVLLIEVLVIVLAA